MLRPQHTKSSHLATSIEHHVVQAHWSAIHAWRRSVRSAPKHTKLSHVATSIEHVLFTWYTFIGQQFMETLSTLRPQHTKLSHLVTSTEHHVVQVHWSAIHGTSLRSAHNFLCCKRMVYSIAAVGFGCCQNVGRANQIREILITTCIGHMIRIENKNRSVSYM